MANISQGIPTNIPLDDVRVEQEEHTYSIFDTDSGNSEQKEYVLDKAPVERIEQVTGKVDDKDNIFEDGVDYKPLTKTDADGNKIVVGVEWLNNDTPDAGTTFEVTYVAKSVIGRFIDSFESELTEIETEIDNTKDSKTLDFAEGEELDKLGSLFGPEIGQRNGRDDQNYRNYLLSVVDSFSSRGTESGIRVPISKTTNLDIDNVKIREDFTDTSYDVVVIDHNVPVDVERIDTVAQISDPSGVKHDKTIFVVPDDTFESKDNILPHKIVLKAGLEDEDWDQINWDVSQWDEFFETSRLEAKDEHSFNITVGNTEADSWDKDKWDTINWDDKTGFEEAQSTDSLTLEQTDILSEDVSLGDTTSEELTLSASQSVEDWDSQNWDTFGWDFLEGLGVSDTESTNVTINNREPQAWDTDDWDEINWDENATAEAMESFDSTLIGVSKTVSDTSNTTDSIVIESNDATYDDSSWDSELVWA